MKTSYDFQILCFDLESCSKFTMIIITTDEIFRAGNLSETDFDFSG